MNKALKQALESDSFIVRGMAMLAHIIVAQFLVGVALAILFTFFGLLA